ncbi:MAG: outer membrane lipoprotein carrier protein LolA [Candidatus Cohnella colombiensis]|uniref:Outer membrane lipoprotein carrier protein LolA n=1 Tax=Candidatus Cohnella colombiensis TaxID=3121368 RepID=A0AA95EXT3_9BACL|nr:MAG: outer membrane lipoprotein carrier protein LolA [Cohnella sp.]
MRRRITWICALALLMTGLLAACGSKNADSIVKDLDKVVSKMESYQGSGTMTLHTGQQPQTYKVEVWYQKPDYYRISLTNEKRDITQIVLRNDEGVFVLTPQLNKSYRFQSDWPKNQGQVYLYQTLIQSIVLDNSRQFTKDKDAYVFDVMAANYQNGSFARQKIWLNQNSYEPQKVEVTDTNSNVMVDVKFDSFTFDAKFEKSAFDMKEIMNIPQAKPSDSNQNNASPSPSASADASQAPDATTPEDDATSAQPQQSAVILEPNLEDLPVGVELLDSSDVQLGEQQGVMFRYTGTYDFTIVEKVSKDRAVTLMEGIGIDLGFTMGHLTEGDAVTLTWTYEGTEYRLTSADLPQQEMVRIAQSMEQSSSK